jgi:hypothetical protein
MTGKSRSEYSDIAGRSRSEYSESVLAESTSIAVHVDEAADEVVHEPDEAVAPI